MSKRNPTHYRTGGTRGGRDQFKWEDVKSDKDRENYLGNSVNATVGRWQKGRDVLWYTKSGVGQGIPALSEEKARLKALDDQLINSALGVVTDHALGVTSNSSSSSSNNRDSCVRKKEMSTKTTHELEADEIRTLLSRGSTATSRGFAGGLDAERVAGLGATGAPRIATHEFVPRQLSSIEKEIAVLKGQKKVTGEEMNTSSSATNAAAAEQPSSRHHHLETKEKNYSADTTTSSSSSRRRDHSNGGSTRYLKHSRSRSRDRDHDRTGHSSQDRNRERDHHHRHNRHNHRHNDHDLNRNRDRGDRDRGDRDRGDRDRGDRDREDRGHKDRDRDRDRDRGNRDRADLGREDRDRVDRDRVDRDRDNGQRHYDNGQGRGDRDRSKEVKS